MNADDLLALLSVIFRAAPSLLGNFSSKVSNLAELTRSTPALWPALFTAVIPLLQFAWKWRRERSLQSGKAALRERVARLDRFLDAVKSIDSPEQQRLREEAEKERAKAVSELLAMATAEKVVVAEPAGMRRWLLIYAPRSIASLVLHMLFYVSFAVGLVAVISLASVSLTLDSGLAGLGIAIGAWLVIASIFREVAVTVDGVGTPNRLERWLLFDRAPRPSGWILRFLFYLTFAIAVIALMVTGILLPREFSDPELLAGIAIIATVPFGIRWLTSLVERTRPPNRLERWLLLYRPVSRWGWIPRVLFYLSLPIAVARIVSSVSDWRNGDTDLFSSIVVIAVMVAVPRLWVAVSERTRPSNRVERWLLLYRPVSRAGWAVHILFYCALVFGLAVLMGVQDLADSDGVSDFLAMAVVAALFLSITRLAAADFDPALAPSPRRGRLRSFLLFYAPAKPVLWILHILFYCLLDGLVGFLGTIPDDVGEDRLEDLIGLGVVIVLAIAVREIASRLDASARRTRSATSGEGLVLHAANGE